MKDALQAFMADAMTYEDRLVEINELIKFLDKEFVWSSNRTNTAQWESYLSAPYFNLNLRVSINVSLKGMAEKTLDQNDTIEGRDTCTLVIYFSCSDESNPVYAKYKEKYGLVNRISLEDVESFKVARERLKEIERFLNGKSE